MKRLLLLLLTLFFVGCFQPKQAQLDFDEEIVGLQDIPLTNMPGHEPPECPLECLCPNLFGLPENPCKKPALTMAEPPFRWYRESELGQAMEVAGNHDKLMLIVMVDTANEFEHKLFLELADKLDNDECTNRTLKKHYIPVMVSWEMYYFLRSTGDLAWLPADYVISPAIMFAKIHETPNGYRGEALHITFDGRIDADMCAILQSFYGATR